MTQARYSQTASDVTDHADRDAQPANPLEARVAGEDRTFGRTGSLRQAVREDLNHGRVWASDQGARALEGIRDEPIKTAVYAIWAGILIGLLLRR